MSSTRLAILELLDAGLSPNQVAWRLGLAPATVRYHAKRRGLARPVQDSSSDGAAASEAESRQPIATVRTRQRVAALLAEGLSRAEIARRLGITKATVSYHARRLGERIDERCARRYDWQAVQLYYDDGHSKQECQRRFGFSSGAWHDAVTRGAIVPRPVAMPLEELLVADQPRGRFNIKIRLLAAGLKENRCEECGIQEWRGRPLSMALHHANGDRHDNRLPNLLFLCPNCHSQTETFAGRNRPPQNAAADTTV